MRRFRIAVEKGVTFLGLTFRIICVVAPVGYYYHRNNFCQRYIWDTCRCRELNKEVPKIYDEKHIFVEYV